MAYQGNLKSKVSDVDMWCNPGSLLVTSFCSSKNCHVAHSNWFASF